MTFIYDIETYPNCFIFGCFCVELNIDYVFTISDFENDSENFYKFLRSRQECGDTLVGFNNLHFDYPVVHSFMQTQGKATPFYLYQKAQSIIDAPEGMQYTHFIYPSDRICTQIDLFKIHHFDNKNRRTSLKTMEFVLRFPLMQELPIKPGTVLQNSEIQQLKQYCLNDIMATFELYKHTLDKIAFRTELSTLLKRDFSNHNDTKIGKDFILSELQKRGVLTHTYGKNGREVVQTKHESICLGDIILPSVEFSNIEFDSILQFLKKQTIKTTKGVFDKLTVKVDGIEYKVGTGGLHGAVDDQIFHTSDTHSIIDIDVVSYYPSIAIQNKFYPEHLTSVFSELYNSLFKARTNYPKGSPINAMLKLALNGVFGDAGQPFSPFYDPAFLLKITLNGQLLLCKLIEFLIPFCKVIQANTDGVTVYVHNDMLQTIKGLVQDWEKFTGLKTESLNYKSFFIRDVNNYLAVTNEGKIKGKGVFVTSPDWYQDHSTLVVAKVVQEFLLNGTSIRTALLTHPDKRDFLIQCKVSKNVTLHIGGVPIADHNIRYVISKNGGELMKLYPPLPKNPTKQRPVKAHKGYKITPVPDLSKLDTVLIDYDYYAEEVEKLCQKMK